jgi:hypothetical protein
VTSPLPESEDLPICEEVTIAAGQELYPDQVTVSVLNAGNKDGLAGDTMQALVDRGFVQGERGNAPARADVVGAEIWTDDPKSAAARLVATYLSKNGKGVAIRQAESDALGVNIIVGDQFRKVVPGRKSVTAAVDTQVCSPPEVE